MGSGGGPSTGKAGGFSQRPGVGTGEVVPSLQWESKEIEENNRMGKTRDLFKKIRDTKGTFLCKDWHNKGQKWYGPNRSRRY